MTELNAVCKNCGRDYGEHTGSNCPGRHQTTFSELKECDDGGPVHPILERGGNGLELTHAGISLRDHFAGLALQGLLADPVQLGMPAKGRPKGITPVKWTYARSAYDYADAMLEARKK